MKINTLGSVILTCLLLSLPGSSRAAEPEVIPLWPGEVPGEKTKLPEEGNTTKANDRSVASKPVLRIGNVSKPTLSIYRPPAGKDTGTAVLVFPGGGYNILALNLEGTEVCEWLNSIGVTAGLVKYRVPKREGLEKHTAPLQDAQRALGLLRQRAGDLKIDPKRIGVLGFSAGGHLAATLCASTATRTYPVVDTADEVSCRPDFTLLIYPAYLTLKDELEKLSPEVAVTPKHAPTFLVMAEDDSVHVEGPLAYYLALKRAKIPAEMHLYPTGGHGYGLRKTGNPIASWPDRATEWLTSQGLLTKK